MVRSSVATVLAMALLSCARAPYAVRDVEPYDALIDVDGAAAVEAFETIERLKDAPLDPRKASVDDLVSIPGFPEALAERVAAAVRSHGAGRSWVERLTPPERALLYRFGESLTLPERPRTSVRARHTETPPAAGAPRRSDARVALAGGGSWQLVVRSRDYDLRRRSAVYASVTEPSGAVRIHLGSFLPDVGMGLLFANGSTAALSFGPFSLWGSRWVVGNTSFYGRSLFGGAVEMWYRSMRAALVAGRPRSFRNDRFEQEAELVRIARAEIRRGCWDVGACAALDGGETRVSLAGSATVGSLKTGFEAAGNGSGQAASAWGLVLARGKTKAVVRFHAIPSGATWRWSVVEGRTVPSRVSESGIVAAVETAVRPGLVARGSVERSVRADGLDGGKRTVMRAECERRGRRSRVRVTWSSRAAEDSPLVPWPGDELPRSTYDETAAIEWEAILRPGLTGKISARYAEGNGHGGVLLSPSLSSTLLSGRARLDGSLAAYRSTNGTQTHYFYEPSLEGMFPWVSAAGTGTRAAVRIVFDFNRLRLMSKIVHEEANGLGVTLQASIGIP